MAFNPKPKQSAAAPRSARADAVRCTAVLFVVCVHFFLNTGFYSQPMEGTEMYLLLCLRTLFMTCVPMFMLLSGYLLAERRFVFSKGYCLRFLKVLVPYVILTAFYFAYAASRGTPFDFREFILNLLSYKQHSWYVETYLGLFLLIPFLNKIWLALPSRKEQRQLILVLVLLTILPTLLNIYDLRASTFHAMFVAPANHTQLAPAWWVRIYPFTYYFLGAYLKKYLSPQPRTALKAALALALCVFCFAGLNYLRSDGGVLLWGAWDDWWSFENFTDAVLMFIILISIPFEKLPQACLSGLRWVSGLAFGTYIASYMGDAIVYSELNARIPDTLDRMPHFLPAVAQVFLLSLGMSFVADLIYRVGFKDLVSSQK